MTGVVISFLLRISNTRLEAWIRLTPSLTLRSTTTGDRALRAAISGSVSVPSTSMAKRVDPCMIHGQRIPYHVVDDEIICRWSNA